MLDGSHVLADIVDHSPDIASSDFGNLNCRAPSFCARTSHCHPCFPLSILWLHVNCEERVKPEEIAMSTLASRHCARPAA